MPELARTLSPRVAAVLRPLLWLLLGSWLGAMLLFGAVVAPAAFGVLPTPELAGDLVGRVLASLHLSGAIAGLILALLAGLLRRGRAAIGLSLLLSALCVVNQFGVSPAVAEIRLSDPGAPLAPGAAERFARLHQLSVLLFGATVVGLLGLAAWLARRDFQDGQLRA